MQHYSMPQTCETLFDAMVYTVRAMKDNSFDSRDIENYVSDALDGDNFHLLEVTEQTLEDCNGPEKDYEDTWRDSYYSSYWDDDYCNDNEHDRYDDFWTVNNALENINKIDDLDELEVYEGFSSCRNSYWDSVDGLKEAIDDYYYEDYGIDNKNC